VNVLFRLMVLRYRIRDPRHYYYHRIIIIILDLACAVPLASMRIPTLQQKHGRYFVSSQQGLVSALGRFEVCTTTLGRWDQGVFGKWWAGGSGELVIAIGAWTLEI
jgi:hypothetical protein